MRIVVLDRKQSGRCSMSGKEGLEVVLAQVREGGAPAWLCLRSLSQLIRLEAAAQNGPDQAERLTAQDLAQEVDDLTRQATDAGGKPPTT